MEIEYSKDENKGGGRMDEKKILDIIAKQLHISEKGLQEDTVFSEIGADSLDLFQIISALEEEFDIEFDNESAESIKTIGDAMEYVKNMLER